MIRNEKEYQALIRLLGTLERGLTEFKEQHPTMTPAESVTVDDYNTLIKFVSRQLNLYIIDTLPEYPNSEKEIKNV